MALFSECRPQCAQTVLDTADIVRDGDISPTTGLGEQDCDTWCLFFMELRPRSETA